jgi:hypothetical protein
MFINVFYPPLKKQKRPVSKLETGLFAEKEGFEPPEV